MLCPTFTSFGTESVAANDFSGLSTSLLPLAYVSLAWGRLLSTTCDNHLERVLKLSESIKKATAPGVLTFQGRSRSDGNEGAVSQRCDGRTMANSGQVVAATE